MDATANLDFNRDRWGNPDHWTGMDQYGYRWSGGLQQSVGGVAALADRYLRPFTGDHYKHDVLELSPGGGRFTAELIRYARSIDLLDMNQACLDVCAERFRYFPTDLGLYLNDGRSCEVLPDKVYTLIACFDSMVHMHPDIVAGYVRQLADRLAPGGILWLDHSGRGVQEQGHRTAVTDSIMRGYGESCGLAVLSQEFRNDHDCITVFRRPELPV